MTKAYAISVDDVIALLQPESVISACGLDARPRGRAFRLRTCPGCGARPARAGAAIYRRRDAWRWTHHGHACGGSLLDLLAVSEGIDPKREFVRLLQLGAKLAGVAPSDPDLERKISEQIAADRVRREREEQDRAAAIVAMPALWDSHQRRSVIGEAALTARDLDAAELIIRGDVRFTADGWIAVAERHLETGDIVGIQYRAPQGKDFRSAEWSAADESALIGRVAELDRQGVDVAVLVEGLTDSLTARLAFPGCAIFGGAGAGHLETIAAAVAARVKDIGGIMLMTVDDDDVGVHAARDAIVAACEAGLVLDRDLLLVDVGEHHDLSDAWRSGWRWTWPS